MDNSKDKREIIIIRPLPMKNQLRPDTLSLPLGPLYLAESLIKAGYKVKIVDTDNQAALAEVDKNLSANTLCFGISTMSGTQLENASIIAKALKEKYPDLPLVWGGVHITALPSETLKSDLVDYIVWGEGENTIIRLLEAVRRGDIDSLLKEPGIGFKKDGKFYIGPNSGYTDLDNCFSLPYHLLDMNKYIRSLNIGAKKEVPVWTSRGCPFRCKFCSNSSSSWLNTKIRLHTIDHIVKDVKTLVRDYGIDMITFGDENFIWNEKRLLDILSAIRKEGISVKYRFLTRIDLLLRLKEKTWETLKKYGLAAVVTGPESGSQKILDYLGKGITLEQIYQLDEILTRHGFYKTYNILICTPAETRDDLNLSLKLILDLAGSSLSSPYPFSLNKYIPLPGTEIYQDAIQHGFRPPEKLLDWGKFDFEDIANTRGLVRPWISKEDFSYIQKAIDLVEKLNSEFKGPEANFKTIKNIIGEIEAFIAEGECQAGINLPKNGKAAVRT